MKNCRKNYGEIICRLKENLQKLKKCLRKYLWVKKLSRKARWITNTQDGVFKGKERSCDWDGACEGLLRRSAKFYFSICVVFFQSIFLIVTYY